jgi:hypothetical protein
MQIILLGLWAVLMLIYLWGVYYDYMLEILNQDILEVISNSKNIVGNSNINVDSNCRTYTVTDHDLSFESRGKYYNLNILVWF